MVVRRNSTLVYPNMKKIHQISRGGYGKPSKQTPFQYLVSLLHFLTKLVTIGDKLVKV